jgi:hypothetical protein
MTTYVTLWGDLDLGALPTGALLLVERLLSLLAEYQREERPGTDWRKKAFEFAARARQEIRRDFPAAGDFLEVLHGPVGAVYRDCFYRLCSLKVPGEERAAFVNDLRFNPSRILVDCYLDGWNSQKEFAAAAGLEAGQVTRIFNYVLEAGAESSLTIKSFKEACEKLQWVPLGRGAAGGAGTAGTGPLRLAPIEDTSARERQLRALVAGVGRYLAALEEAAGSRPAILDACRRLLGLHLAAIYGITDILILDDLANTLLLEMLTPPQLEVRQEDAEPTERLAAFQRGGPDAAEGPVLVVDPELQKLLADCLPQVAQAPPAPRPGQTPAAGPPLAGPYAEAVRAGWEQSLRTYHRWLGSPRFRKSRQALEKKFGTAPAKEKPPRTGAAADVPAPAQAGSGRRAALLPRMTPDGAAAIRSDAVPSWHI